MIINADSLAHLKTMEENSVDCMITDPPYGLAFMGRDWDKAVIPKEHWAECLRVMKPGAFACIMSAPRQDVLARSIINVQDAGFNTNYTSIYWAYSTGFPKYARTDLAIDKRLGVESEKINIGKRSTHTVSENGQRSFVKNSDWINVDSKLATSPQAKAMKGSILGFQPKPAVEPILIAMKPTDGSYLDQAMKDGHGVSWVNDCEIPYTDKKYKQTSYIDFSATRSDLNKLGRQADIMNPHKNHKRVEIPQDDNKGRFPANVATINGGTGVESFDSKFSVDAWAAQFVITPKASRSEKEKGLSLRNADTVDDGRTKVNDTAYQRGATKRLNTHPTVKPIKLMAYLITMFSRPGHTVLDPFAGSGTTGIAAGMLGREFVGIEMDADHCRMAEARLEYWKGRTLEGAEKPKEGLDAFLT